MVRRNRLLTPHAEKQSGKYTPRLAALFVFLHARLYGRRRQLLFGLAGTVLLRSTQSMINSRISSLER